MSRHHILPPLVQTPAPPKLRETRRRRRVGYGMGAADSVDEAEETTEAVRPAPLRNAAPPQQERPVEAVERRADSPTGRLSTDTLKALLVMQEQSARGER
jgi:hypothetical protein